MNQYPLRCIQLTLQTRGPIYNVIHNVRLLCHDAIWRFQCLDLVSALWISAILWGDREVEKQIGNRNGHKLLWKNKQGTPD